MMAVCLARRRQARMLIGMSECIGRTEARVNTAQQKYSTKTAEHTFEKLIGHISNLNRIQNLEVLVWPGVIHFNDRNIQVQRP